MFFSIPIYQGPPRSFLNQLRTRLILSLSILVCCLLITSALGIYVSLRQQQLGEQKVFIHDTESTLLTAMLDEETGLRGYITTANSDFLQPYNDAQTTYPTTLQNLQRTITDANFTKTALSLREFEDRASTWSTTYATSQINHIKAGQYTIARADATVSQGKVLFDSVRTAFANLQQASDQDLADLQVSTNAVNFSAFGLAMLITILVLVWLWRTFRLFSNVQRLHLNLLKDASEAFGRGDLDFQIQDGPDIEFNAVTRTFNVMATTLDEQQQALRNRDILEHVSTVNAILTKSLDLTSLLDQLFKYMLTSLDLQVATLYVFEPDRTHLAHVASRGIPSEALQKHVSSGEGLIGRVAEEGEALFLGAHGEQDRSFQVKTIFGEVIPASMYYLPLLHGGEVLGVLVVGSLYPMREQTRHILDVSRSNLASALHNIQSYERTQQLAEQLAQRSRQQEESNRILRQQRDELSVVNGALEEANRVRAQFLSTMSHELRTPLTSIIGFSQMLQRIVGNNQLTNRQQQNVERILKNAQHLLSLINDVLDLSKIEAGHMDVVSNEVHLDELLTSVVEETQSIAQERKLELRLELQENLPVLETDERKVRQIILNLLSNALKFTEKGFVRLDATTQKLEREGQERNEYVQITVQDTGIGIPQEKQAHIFDAFYQVDSSNSRNYGGTGLGLSIVRELTILLGGKITFESVPGEGTTFRLILPKRLREQRFLEQFRLHTSETPLSHTNQVAQQITLDSVAALHLQKGESEAPLVLAIDDNPDVLHLIAQALEQSPYRLVGVQDSTQAMAVIEQLKPSVITLDIMMPQINGWELLHALKLNPVTSSIPVVLLTVLEDRSAGYVLGADEYLVKPVTRDKLLTALQQMLSRQPSTEVKGEMQSQPGNNQVENPGANPVALVPHEPDIPVLLKRLVDEAGYQIKSASVDEDIIPLVLRNKPDLLMLLVRLEEGSIVVESASLEPPQNSSVTDPPSENGSAPSVVDGISASNPPAPTLESEHGSASSQ